ncbi:TIGR02450 family Trp-rich protein [Pseudoalteromonas sp. KG3]|uniref:TIGR02450 family Trp-rich protein n=1 Tax=Pseudoalteromonas sp. KG3 TaxID=2951137 RepID=UPI0026591C3A|nr:TIGR02450 family Trp-rich protein [Pseudoalteromonas sp. KG3]WKD23287.1 TIGR02450 family Trp-rich protein [Pseudoalteromonas sp. KG3]
MNKITPKKLLHSKWTAVSPVNKEKHFMITDMEFDEEGVVISCIIEAVMSKRSMTINWQDLKDQQRWLQGWQ